MWTTVALAALVAYVLDRAVAEPPASIHPVALFGRAVAGFEREWVRPRATGIALAALAPLAAAAVVGAVVFAGWRVAPVVGGVLAGLVLFVTTSRRMLLDRASEVAAASDADPTTARERLPALAGRDPAALSPAEMRSAAVESAGENLADGLVAPLFAFALVAPFSLALGAAAAAWVKAINTLDSMFGYRDGPMGAGSARLDDVVMWVPARLTAGLLAATALSPAPLSAARRWAREPCSPNSGWPMGAVAGALGVRLEKPDRYVLNPGAELPTVEEALAAVRLVGRTGTLAFVLVASPGIVRFVFGLEGIA